MGLDWFSVRLALWASVSYAKIGRFVIMCSDEINMTNASRAKSHVANAIRYTRALQEVVTYMRTDHIGMLRGDGDLTRYVNFLCAKIDTETRAAEAQLRSANVPDELPF